MVSFRAAAREALWPRDLFGRAVLALVALRTPILWLTAWLGRHEPIEVTAMYRPGGDVQYYELVGAYGRGNFGEANLFESAGQGLHPFPLGSMWLHTLLFAPFGAWGIFLADILVTLVAYAVLVTLGRTCQLSPRRAVAFAAFVCGYLYVALTPVTNRIGWMPDLLWGDRFPRPFLTETYVMASYAVLVRFWLARRKEGQGPDKPFPVAFWAGAGLVFTLLVQSDVYSAFIVGLAYSVIIGERLLVRPSLRKETLRGIGAFVAVLLLTAWPFALQQRTMTPGLNLRWGVYALPRLTALSWVRYTPVSGPLFVTVAAAVVLYGVHKRGQDWRPSAAVAGGSGGITEARSVASVVWFWCMMAALAALAFPLFFVITGKGLYPYQSADRLRRVSMFALSFITLSGLSLVWPSAAFEKRRWMRTALASGILLAMAGGIGARAIERLGREDHVRTWYKLGPGVRYRTAFTELVRELAKPQYRKAVVLGTFDQEVHVHWQTFLGGRSFVPDGFVSIASNEEMERRFVLFTRLIGASTDEFLQMVQAAPHTGLVFDSKYATNSAFAMAPLSDYTAEQAQRIRSRDIFTSFAFEVPLSELTRLRRVYEGADFREASPRLDLVVLNNDARFGNLAPPAADFDLLFENTLFRLYARKGLLP